MTISTHAVAVRAVAAASVVALALEHWLVTSSDVTGAAAAAAALAAAAGAVWPASPAPTLALLALAGGFIAASADVSDAVLLPWTVAEAAALWAVHQLFAFAAAVPLDAAVDARAVRRLGERLVMTLAVVVPAVIVVMLAGNVVRPGAVVRVLGTVAAAAACALPAYLLRADRAR